VAALPFDWGPASRKASDELPGVLDALHRMFERDTSEAAHPAIWTLRHRITGRIRGLTARTELEATVKIANGLFDAA